MAEGFARFAELAREIDRVRVTENARSAGMQSSAAEMSHHADELDARLQVQHAALGKLADVMHFRAPDFTPSLPVGEVDPPTSLTQIAKAIDQADHAANQIAGRRAEGHGNILDSFSFAGRQSVIYGVAAVVIALLQLPKWRDLMDKKPATPDPSFVSTMVVLPAIVFLVAYLLLRFANRGRLSKARRWAGTRVGIVLCFAIGPLGLLITFLLSLKQILAT